MIEVTIVGTNGEEFAYGSCPSAQTIFEQAEMVASFVKMRFPGQAEVVYRSLEDGQDEGLAGRVRRGELELPLVLFDGQVRFEGGVPWQDIQRELKRSLAL